MHINDTGQSKKLRFLEAYLSPREPPGGCHQSASIPAFHLGVAALFYFSIICSVRMAMLSAAAVVVIVVVAASLSLSSL